MVFVQSMIRDGVELATTDSLGREVPGTSRMP